MRRNTVVWITPKICGVWHKEVNFNMAELQHAL